MRLLREGRQRIETFMRERASRLDRTFLNSLIPKKIPSLAQLQHIDLFLEPWERRIIGAAGTFALIALIGIGFSIWSRGSITIPANGGQLQEALVGAPLHINPLFATSDTDRTLTNILYLPLCDGFDHDIPMLATKCTITDEKRALITLSPNRTWDDGTPITSDDVLFTFEKLRDPLVGSPWLQLAKRMTVGIDADGSIIINAKQPTKELRTLLSLGIIPKHIWNDTENKKISTSPHNLKPIGNGAFKLGRVATDHDGAIQTITLDATDSFQPHRPYLDHLEFRIVEDEAAARELFRLRQIDSLFLYDSTDNSDILKPDVNGHELTSSAVVSLFFNLSHSALARKPDFRAAAALSIDRTKIIKDALQGHGIPTRAPFPLNMLREPAAQQPEKNSNAAAELFKKAFGASTSTAMILAIPQNPTYEAVGSYLRDTLAPYGITIQTRTMDSASSATDLLNASDLALLGQDYGQAGNAPPFWHSSASGVGGANFSRYQNKEADTLLENLAVEGDPSIRTKLLNKLTQKLITDAPALFLYEPTYTYYISNKIKQVTIPVSTDMAERFEKSFEWYTALARTWKFDR